MTRLTNNKPRQLEEKQIMPVRQLRVIVAGLGYFSQFHLAAWSEHENARICGVCDNDPDRLADAAKTLGVPGNVNLAELLEIVDADIVDIVAPPNAHDELVRAAFSKGRTIICQKPFCTSLAQARALLKAADAAGTQIVIHENFRFQPWHREARDFLDSGRMGQIYQARFALRPGDGRGVDAYLDRQPTFQTMHRFLIHETAVHFIDLFRWLMGDVVSVYADLRQLNPAIQGEDAGLMILTHTSGTTSVFDGNRLSDHATTNPRRTMGEMQIEGEGGVLFLDGEGQLTFRPFGSQEIETIPVTRDVDDTSFGGGCVAALIDHVIQALVQNRVPENLAQDYLHVMQVKEAAYQSDSESRQIHIKEAQN